MFRRIESWVWLAVWLAHLLLGLLLTRADARFVPIGFNPMLLSFCLLYAMENFRFQGALEEKNIEYGDFADSITERLFSGIIVASMLFLMVSGVFLPWFNLLGTAILAIALLAGKLFIFRQKPSTFNWSWAVFFALTLSVTALEYARPLGNDTPALIYYLKLVLPTLLGLIWTIESEALLAGLDDPAVRDQK